MQQQPKAQTIASGKSSRRGGRGGQRYNLTHDGRTFKGLTAKQVADSIDWTHCDGEHNGVQVKSLYIGRADDTHMAIAEGEGKSNLQLVPAVDFIVAHQRALDLANSIFNEQRAAGKI